MHNLVKSHSDQVHSSYKLDVSNFEEVQIVFSQIEKDFKRVDGLINCAGINVDGLLVRSSKNDIQNVIQTNLIGSMYCAKNVIRGMTKQGSGNIINIGSIIGSHGNVGQSVYAASKAGLIGFTKSLAKEVGSKGVRVNLIEPGYFETEMTAQLPEKQKHEILNQILLKRFGNSDDITSAVVFLLENKFITGQILAIDGGMFL
jgi:3-oxoacyl-[acyl-carrier protein] reductase